MRPTIRRQTPASSLGSAEEYTPGLLMECEMNEVPSTTTSSHSVTWPVKPDLAARMQRLPTTLLPAIADRRQAPNARRCGTLCAIMIRLSSFTPSSMTVSSMSAAVDGGVGADLDVVTDVHAADLRHLDPGAFFGRESKAVAANHCAGLNDAALAEDHMVTDEHARDQARIVANAAPRSITEPGPMKQRAPMRAPSPMNACAAISAVGSIVAPPRS